MTNQDVMIQILHEVTGQSKKQIRRIVKATRAALPDKGRKYDQTLTPAEAKELLAALRAERAGILAWLVQGSLEARSLSIAVRKAAAG